MSLTPEELAAIRARAEAATPNWVEGTMGVDDDHGNLARVYVYGHPNDGSGEARYAAAVDFIVNARTDIPRLLDALKATQAALDQCVALSDDTIKALRDAGANNHSPYPHRCVAALAQERDEARTALAEAQRKLAQATRSRETRKEQLAACMREVTMRDERINKLLAAKLATAVQALERVVGCYPHGVASKALEAINAEAPPK